jgi:hypothetical protein
MSEVKLYKRPLKQVRYFLLTIPFVAIGIWMISSEPTGTTNYIVGWLCASFFGLIILVGLFKLFDRRPQIIVTEQGIWDRTTREAEISWEQIQSAYPLSIFTQRFVSLVVDDTFIVKDNLFKWVSKINHVIGAQKVNLYVSELGIDEHRMTIFINEIISSDNLSRKAIIEKHFGNLTVD